MSLMNMSMLEHYVKTGRNVLFEGHRGVGKTATIDGVFTMCGLRWKYFSAPTMDPWVDLVGVPKVIEREGRRSVTELIRPWYIEDDVYDAIFFDELNRASSKTLDAVLELIQFKSINGHKLNNLKCVWGAINPYDDTGTYNVEELDPALIDRFHCYIKFPYKIDEDYFRGKYPSIASYFIDWWNALPADAQAKVSPRRLEYLVEGYLDGSRLEDIVAPEPGKINIKELRDSIKAIPFKDLLAQTTELDAAKAILSQGNNVTKLLDLVKKKDPAATEFFTKFKGELPQEIVQPFIDAVAASKKKNAKVFTIKTLDDVIDLVPNESADAGVGTMINDMDFRVMLSNGVTIESELNRIYTTKPHLIRKLSNRFADILISCRQPTIDRLMWGIAGRIGNQPTNFQQITMAVSKKSIAAAGSIWTNNQWKYIKPKIEAALQPVDGQAEMKTTELVEVSE